MLVREYKMSIVLSPLLLSPTMVQALLTQYNFVTMPSSVTAILCTTRAAVAIESLNQNSASVKVLA